MGKEFDYAKEFKTLDLNAVIKDLTALMTDSQEWWPADFGHYGGLMIRLAWHAAGTYRITDGRGGAGAGQQRFAPLNSWPDNANLDKARRLLWPIKQKYGRKLSWADLMVLAGNVALESMGFKTFGFAGGRADVWEPEELLLGSRRHVARRRTLQRRTPACGAARRGADGPDLRQSGRAERQSRPDRGGQGHPRNVLPHGDERRGDRRADCRRPHLRQDPRRRRSVAGRTGAGRRRPSRIRASAGRANTTPASAATPSPAARKSSGRTTPTKWSNNFFWNLFGYEWELEKSPAGAKQWRAKGAGATIPDAFDKSKKHVPKMLTTDLSLRFDPAYEKISRRFLENPDQFADAFARAWFKLTHRDMGPIQRYLGPLVPKETLIWQDPIPAGDHPLIDERTPPR